MLLKVLILVASLSQVLAVVDRARLSKFPPTVKHFDQERWLGRWFNLAHLPSCTWSGAVEFTDIEENLYMDGKTVVVANTWRSGDCTTTLGRFTPTGGSGCYIGKDSIGNVWSGKVNVAAIEYDRYFIYWGCVKPSAFGDKCDDSYISVYIRDPESTRKVKIAIEDTLKALWGLSLNDLHFDVKTTPCKPRPNRHTPKQSPRRFKLY